MLFAKVSNAQYNNEWIDYTKTYYKFKVGATGLYRITQPVLATAELQTTPAAQFQLWRNGKQVPLYTSNIGPVLLPNDYIEFWGEKNDGLADKALYKTPDLQLTDRISLQTDTAAYFLTVSTNIAANLRYSNTANNINGGETPTPYFIHAIRHQYKIIKNPGAAELAGGEYLHSSAYEAGEMWSSAEIYNNTPAQLTFSDLYTYAAGPSATLKAGLAGTAPNSRRINVELNNQIIIDTNFVRFDAAVAGRYNNLSNAILGNAANISVQNKSANGNDRIVSAFVELSYARQFNFGNQGSFYFTLGSNSTGFISVTNFNHGGVAPVLYDLTNNRRYIADIVTTPGSVQVLLVPGAYTGNFVLVSQSQSNINSVGQLTTKVFTNYANASNQGDYVMITHKTLRAAPDYVEQYRAYRASTNGGSYNAKIYDIDDIVDQFAFGIKKHPIAVKNFIRYTQNAFTTPSKMVLLIGHGVTYNQYNETSDAERLNEVPTFGHPGSDVMLAAAAYEPIPMVPIGRISVLTPGELNDYFTKLKEYEQAQQSTTQTVAGKGWMKNVVHVAGGNDASLSDRLDNYFTRYKDMVKDSLFGARVSTFSKATSGPVTSITNAAMNQLWQEGISLITFFGHSSSSSLDYNLDDPYQYNNPGKYPVFLVNGCSAGNFFNNDPVRFSSYPTLSEKYVLAKNRGTIAFIASTSFGLEYQLDVYSTGFYKSLSSPTYNKPLGNTIKDAIVYLLNSYPYPQNFYYRIHAEQTLLHGDPAIKINAHPKPDFVVEEPQIKVSPSFISVAENSFSVKAYLYNIGKASGDSVSVRMTRQYPDGTSEIVISKKIKAVRYIDSLSISLPIIAARDKGENKITVFIDDALAYDEMSESNNGATTSVFIFEDELRPVYPYNYAIINKPNAKLQASTANPFATARNYLMEMDTTELFNSSFKITKNINSIGGVLEFDPAISYTDGTAYYWRVAPAPSSGLPRWNTSSFIYLSQANTLGYNQSHFYQHKKSTGNKLLMGDDRKWKFADSIYNFYIVNSVYPNSGTEDVHFSIAINGTLVTQSACVGNSIIYNVFDPVTMKPLYNQTIPGITAAGTPGGFMGSGPVCAEARKFNFEFRHDTELTRNQMRDFLNWVGDKYVVTARLIFDPGNTSQPYVNQWKLDNGGVNNLYTTLKAAGFAGLDDYTSPKTWAFIYKKNDNSFIPKYTVSPTVNDRVFISADVAGPNAAGTLTSATFGPVAAWKSVKWNGTSVETINHDEISLDVIGVTPSGAETVLYNLNNTQQDFNISTVSNVQYPYIKLKLHAKDTVNFTPYQLNYWRVINDPLPEGAIAPNVKLAFKDTLELNEPHGVTIAFKNVSDMPMGIDTIKVEMIVYDKNNVATTLPVTKIKKLNPGDTAIISCRIDTRNLAGLNNLFVEVNPDNFLPEQYHFNNFFYRNFYVKGDAANPLMDITFDGVHILNGDIVAARPHILAKLKDEAQYLPLDDTSLVTINLRYPDGTNRRFAFGTDTLRFTPATPGGVNEATVDFSPALPEDGEYELSVKGKDKVGNSAGNIDYRVTFNVYNKPMISNMFNYPNPFTSSTAFVFTLTGTEIPQNLRIQIMTVTGKIVKEITKEELGQIHIGRNITDYKWDGTDQYGQKLGNGVYLYRVITNLNGNKLDKFDTQDVNGKIDTDKYFNKGYGKMYLMR